MSGLVAQTPRLRRLSRIDLALADLVRIVMADGYTPDGGAALLRAHVCDDRPLLRMLRARVARVMLERPTQLGVRAAATLDLALASSELAALVRGDRRSTGQVASR